MSWYGDEMTKCFQCGERFSTPIDRHQHSLNCRVKRNSDQTINVEGLGTGVVERVTVTRGVIYWENMIWITTSGGSKLRVKVVNVQDDGKVLVVVCPTKKDLKKAFG